MFDYEQYKKVKEALVNRAIENNTAIYLIETNFHYGYDSMGRQKKWVDAKRGDFISYNTKAIPNQAGRDLDEHYWSNTEPEEEDYEKDIIVKDVYKVNDDVVIEAVGGYIYTTIRLGEELKQALAKKELEKQTDLTLAAMSENGRFWKYNTNALCKELNIQIPSEQRRNHLQNISATCYDFIQSLDADRQLPLALTESEINMLALRIRETIDRYKYEIRDEKLEILTESYLDKKKPIICISDMTVSDGNCKFYRFADLKRGGTIEVSCGGQLVTADGLKDMDRVNEKDTVIGKLREDNGFIIETNSAIYTNIEDFAHKCHQVLHERENQNQVLGFDKEAQDCENAQEYDAPDISNR